MGRLTQDECGQSLLTAALFMAFIGLMLMAAIGIAAAYSHLAQAQTAADAAALAGAREAKGTEVRVGPHAVCRFPEIDPSRAMVQAQSFWDANLSGSPLLTDSFSAELFPQSRPTRFFLLAHVRLPAGILGVLGKSSISLPVAAEAALEQDCENTLTGPVFAQTRALPTGWPVPGAEWVWNWPGAEQNAPVGWPVYFVTVFNLPTDQNVTVYVAADADYEVGIDTNVVLSGSGTTVESADVYLTRGTHMLWVKATNEAPDTPFAGPNSAGIIVGAINDRSEVVAVTKGNSVENIGRPSNAGDWASWSPPNPDWTVYVDPFYPLRWASGGQELAKILQDVGFTLRSADNLRSWMLAVLGTGRAPRTVAVMAQDVVPDTIADSPTPSTIIRHYLNAGGSVLWFGDAPFYAQGTADGSQVTWGETAQEQILGIPGPSDHWVTDPGVSVTPEPGAAGYGIGVSPWWQTPQSQRAIPSHCWVQSLAASNNGGISMWRVPYWPLAPNCDKGAQYIQNARRQDAPGFVRVWDSPINLANHQSLLAIVTLTGQLAGWYRGQTQ